MVVDVMGHAVNCAWWVWRSRYAKLETPPSAQVTHVVKGCLCLQTPSA